jgi:DNA-directed RNA polymerase subunit L
MDIKLKINRLEESVNNLNNNELSLLLSGKDINYAIVNTLRRLVMTSVPIYAFHQDDMKFDINTSVFNNDMLKDRFRNIPIFNIDNDESTINSFDELETRKNRIVDKTNNLTMFINVKNNKDTILNVTTNEALFYYKGAQIDSPYKKPLLLIKLKKGQELKVTCVASLNIGKNDGIYNGSMAYHYYDDDEKNKTKPQFELVINTSRQLDEFELLTRACHILVNKTHKLEKLILFNLEKEDDKEVLNKGLLKIQDENATLGSLISYYLQEGKNMEFSGYQIPFLYMNEILIRYRTDGKDITDILKKTFNQIREIFYHIDKEIKKL